MQVKMKSPAKLSKMVYDYRPKRASRVQEYMDLFVINGRGFFVRRKISSLLEKYKERNRMLCGEAASAERMDNDAKYTLPHDIIRKRLPARLYTVCRLSKFLAEYVRYNGI